MEPPVDKIDPCSSGWLRNSDNTLEPLWFLGPQFPEELRKRNKKDLHQAKQTNATASENIAKSITRPQRFSSLVAKYALQDIHEYEDDDIDNISDNDGDYSGSESGSFDSESDSDEADI